MSNFHIVVRVGVPMFNLKRGMRGVCVGFSQKHDAHLFNFDGVVVPLHNRLYKRI